MHHYLPPLLAFGVPGTLGLAAFVYLRRMADNPAAPIVVVDRRTMRLAQQRITEAIADGHPARANAGLIALMKWLRSEIHTGPRRHRIAYAAALEQAELRKSQLLESVGLRGYTT